MILNDTFFIAICFFTIGFLSLVWFISLYLSLYFKLKIYRFYNLYILSILLFIIAVYIKNTGDFPIDSVRRNVMQLLVDALQMIGSLLFCAFIYNTMLRENHEFQKLRFIYHLFAGLILGYLLLIFLFPDFIRTNFVFFVISRVIIILVSMVFYYNIGKNLRQVYFRYLFLAITFLFLSGFMGIWDSVANSRSIYTGFQYLCMGYFLENICFLGAFIYKYFNTHKEKEEREVQHEIKLIATQIEMQQQTMSYIGREIHDNIGQKLTLASLLAQQLSYEDNLQQHQEPVESISLMINQSLAELRQLSRTLTDPSIEKKNIYDLFSDECDRINELKLCDVALICSNRNITLPYQTKSILLRIAQEFFQNSIKHSSCKKIIVILNAVDKNINLTLVDDGVGFKLENVPEKGIGIQNMKKRTELLNGNFVIESKKHIGTKVTITLPA